MRYENRGDKFFILLIILLSIVVLWAIIPDSFFNTGILGKINRNLDAPLIGITNDLKIIGDSLSNMFKGLSR